MPAKENLFCVNNFRLILKKPEFVDFVAGSTIQPGPATLSRPLRRGMLAGWRNYDLSFQQGFFFQRAAVGRLRLRFLPYGVSRDGGEPQCECELLVALPAGVVCTHLRV